jgi:hypothetical protein
MERLKLKAFRKSQLGQDIFEKNSQLGQDIFEKNFLCEMIKKETFHK